MSAGEQVERFSARLLGRLRPHVRVLGDGDRQPLMQLCRRDPVAHVFVIERLLSGVPLGRGGQLWGWFEDGDLVSACWSGANLVVVEATPAAVAAFADKAAAEGRRCLSMFGPADQTLALWQRLSTVWDKPREVRANQPLMLAERPSRAQRDPLVRLATPADLDALIPSCVAMFTEEVGYSPVGGDGGWSYRARVEFLVRNGRSFVHFDHTQRQVVFKAEIGALSDTVAQIQGVFVNPEHRGRGLAAAGMAAVIEHTRRRVPQVSLYVNDFNTRALAAYERVGFRQVGRFATVLF